MVRVKLCGLMSGEEVKMAEDAGADALGFVTEYPVPVPWNLDREVASSLVAAVSPFVTTVAVVGGPPREVIEIAKKVRPRVLQLHGDESLTDIRQILDGLWGTGIRVIKALRVDIESGLARFEESDPVKACVSLAGSGVAGLVIDSRTTSRPAGTGVTLDWDMSARIVEELDLPLILAGGLTVGNVREAIDKVKPYAVDVISGVERERGIKDPEKMRGFVKAAKGMKCSDLDM